MRLIRRILRNIFAIAPFLLLPGMYGLSYFRSFSVFWLRGGATSLVVLSETGTITIAILPPAATIESPPSFDVVIDRSANSPRVLINYYAIEENWSYAGAAYGTSWLYSDQTLGTVRLLQIPYWMTLIPVLLVGFRRLRQGAVRWKRLRGGLCLNCGYDLRASTERCPECGTLIVAVK